MRLKTLFSCSNLVASSSLFTSTAKDGVFERSQSTNESFSRPLVLSFFYHSQHHIFHVLAQTSFGKLTKKGFFSSSQYLVCRCQRDDLLCTISVVGSCGPASNLTSSHNHNGLFIVMIPKNIALLVEKAGEFAFLMLFLTKPELV